MLSGERILVSWFGNLMVPAGLISCGMLLLSPLKLRNVDWFSHGRFQSWFISDTLNFSQLVTIWMMILYYELLMIQ